MSGAAAPRRTLVVSAARAPAVARRVDIVVDVAASRLEGAFSYRVDGTDPPIGARVRVPFANRIVGGWVVSDAYDGPETQMLKAVAGVEEDAPRIDPRLIRLAEWMYRRYACTFREALGAVAGKSVDKTGRPRFRFSAQASSGDREAQTLRERFGEKPFTQLSARAALRASGVRVDLSSVGGLLERLIRSGDVERIAATPIGRTAATRSWAVRLVDAGKAKGPLQQRVAAALNAAPSAEMELVALSKAASAPAAAIKRLCTRGALCALREVTRGPEDSEAAPGYVATPAQRAAIDAIVSAVDDGSVVLLHGVTGSGKTFVYARAIDRVRAGGGRAIVLVPEIALTPQTAARFGALFGADVAVVHSGLSDGERARVWQDAARGSIGVVVGARSAVFAPLPDLRLIVIDEEHEPSYKQDVAPRYDTAAVARERMRALGGAVVLGSATPSLETYQEALSGGMRYVRLLERATRAPLPPVEIVDMTVDAGPHGRRPLGAALVGAMEHALGRGEKVLLFVNRRGYAALLLCRACGFAPRCRRCSVSLVVHTADGSMRCHVCGDAYRVAARCPKCGSDDLKPFGFGTQRVEEEVRALFPSARTVRMDSDTTGARGAHRALLETFGKGADVLIGTQMIAKGLDFPTVTVVGVVAADVDLNRPDFRSAERTFALLTQVAGRAGRASPGARVVVQTFSPDHYAVRLASRHDYEAFAAKELALRRELRYPPFGRLAYLSVTSVDVALVTETGQALAHALRTHSSGVEVLGPAPDPLAKARGEYRMRIALKAETIEPLLDAIARAKQTNIPRSVRLTPIVDPR